jgi:hypothetical protein
MNRTRLAAVLAGVVLALGTPTAAFAAPEPTPLVEQDSTELTADGIAVLGIFGGVGAFAVFALLVSARPRGL